MRCWLYFLIIMTLTSCTIYSSSGRKEFESKSPDYMKTAAFVGCDILELQEYPEFLEQFSARSFYSDKQFLVAEDTGPLVEVVDLKAEKICTYQFNDQASWDTTKPYLLQHLP